MKEDIETLRELFRSFRIYNVCQINLRVKIPDTN